ncbi:MAG: hypothetical protein SOW12_04285 [Lachnospiraceae bacterium]|nr:hypothetical protein [Lachnoclostridium sp.]MDD7522327.1 hypothetical protein [Lachnoclostridium sp.]MDY2599135.1 hypothetical protein [Lachnospiraceae bacterium]
MAKRFSFWIYIILILTCAHFVLYSSLVRIRVEEAEEQGNTKLNNLSSECLITEEYFLGDVDYNIGYFEEGGRSLSTAFKETRIYLVPVTLDGQTSQYIGVRVSSDNYEVFDNMTGTILSYSDYKSKLTEENKQYEIAGKKVAYSETELSEAVNRISAMAESMSIDKCSEYIVKYYIDYASFEPMKSNIFVFTIIGLILILFFMKSVKEYRMATADYDTRMVSKYHNEEKFNENYSKVNGYVKQNNDFSEVNKGCMDVYEDDWQQVEKEKKTINQGFARKREFNKQIGADDVYGIDSYGSNGYGNGGSYGAGGLYDDRRPYGQESPYTGGGINETARQFNPDTPYDMYGDRSNVVNTDTSYRSSLFGYDTDNNTGNTTDNNTGNNTDTYGTDDSSDTYGSDNQ